MLPEQYFIDPTSKRAIEAQKHKQAKAQEPSTEDKVLILTSQIEKMDAQLRAMKQEQQREKELDEQHRKWAKDEDESARGWTELEIAAAKDLGPEGRAE